MEFVRRFASPESPEHSPMGLTVDTSVLKDMKSKTRTFDASQTRQPQWVASPPASAGGRLSNNSNNAEDAPSPSALSASLPSGDGDRFMRRRRSHSECLFLAKQQGTQELPGPCQEYISNVKQILAKNEDLQMQLKRRRSMSLKQNAQLFK